MLAQPARWRGGQASSQAAGERGNDWGGSGFSGFFALAREDFRWFRTLFTVPAARFPF
jgi:hypothetical protein